MSTAYFIVLDEADPGDVKDIEAVIEDLQEYVRVFNEAEKRDLKWHLELDF